MIFGGSNVPVSTKSFFDSDIHIGCKKLHYATLHYYTLYFLSLVTLMLFKVSHNHISIEP